MLISSITLRNALLEPSNILEVIGLSFHPTTTFTMNAYVPTKPRDQSSRPLMTIPDSRIDRIVSYSKIIVASFEEHANYLFV